MPDDRVSLRNYLPVLLSAGIALYFVFLILVSQFKLDYVLVGVFVELFTIPALAALLGYCGYNIWRGFRAPRGQRRVHWMAVAILVGCMVMLGWMSF